MNTHDGKISNNIRACYYPYDNVDVWKTVITGYNYNESRRKKKNFGS